jgi:3-methyladenine DNA glycosylase Tag
MALSYCIAASSHPAHQQYHDTEHGFPLRDDAALFMSRLHALTLRGRR